jgi:hypothetical protein
LGSPGAAIYSSLGEDDSWPASGPVREFAISSVDAFGIRLVGDEPHLRDLATLEGAPSDTDFDGGAILLVLAGAEMLFANGRRLSVRSKSTRKENGFLQARNVYFLRCWCWFSAKEAS